MLGDGNESRHILEQLEELCKDQKLIQESIKDIRDKIQQEVERLRSSQNYLYQELSRDLEELRDERPLAISPINTNAEDSKSSTEPLKDRTLNAMFEDDLSPITLTEM